MKKQLQILAISLVGLTCIAKPAFAQSTFGSILGAIRDPSARGVPKAHIKLTNTEENTSREADSDDDGNYLFVNTKAGHYRIEVSAEGFQNYAAQDLQLVARQTLRVDVQVQVGQVSNTVTVEGTAGVITTDTQTIQASFDSKALLELPANVRAAGNTSPYDLISALPGVQADDGDSRTGRGANFSIQGGIQSMSQFSLDGISITNVGGNSPLQQAFPSVESIAEIKVQGVGNAAEFAQAGDVTTVSKSGTNDLHGSLFWYHQNRALDATNYGALVKPQKIGNDYGVSVGGPVVLPHIYHGRNKTFFFGTFEGFQYPLGKTIQDQVPTQALRDGNFSGSSIVIKDPLTGQPFENNVIPSSRINSVAKGFLTLYPLPNTGDPNTVHAANFVANRSNSYSSNQFDTRIDHYLTSKMSIFGRYTQKDISLDNPQDLLVPSETQTDKYKLLVVSHNWAILPNLINEFRFGFTLNDGAQTLPFDGRAFLKSLGLQGLGTNFPFNGLSDLNIGSYTGLHTDRGESNSKNDTWQWNNNTTWTVQRHTLKAGFDFRRIRALSPLGFLSGDNYGQFNFDGSFSGDAFADFLLGLPHDTALDNVQKDNDGRSTHYAIFAQDTWRATDRLSLEFGIRWEYHPAYTDASGNIGNFNPAVARSGQVVYPTGKDSLLAPGYLASFNACPQLGSTAGPTVNGAPCTPVLSAKEAGLPEGLRTAPTRVVPRFGFAYRPFANDKTSIRGGFGMFNTPSLGSIFYALTGTLQSDTRQFPNVGPTGQPVFQWPDVRTGGSGIQVPDYGTAYFGTANDIQWKEPYSMQWNFSVDQQFGGNTGIRLSYIGMHTVDLVWAPNLNQSYYSTEFFAAQPLSNRPFPNWGTVNNRSVGANAKYNALQTEVRHRFSHGLTFQSSYTWAKNMADNQGPVPDHFADENAGSRTMDLYNRRAEWGNVYGTRRHRFLTTASYDLPVGRGRAFMANAHPIADAVLGGWRLSSIFLLQTGPYLTPYFNGGDPSGTGSGYQRSQHPDRVKDGNLSNADRNGWIDTTAFVCPATPGWSIGQPCTIGSNPGSTLAPIGRFGNSGVGIIKGPGTVNVNLAMGKSFSITERVRLKFEGAFTNVANHVNLGNPVMGIDNPSFGVITQARPAEFGGSRTGQVSARFEF
jgi:hypothetical protein